MSANEILDHTALARGMFTQQTAHAADMSPISLWGPVISIKRRHDNRRESVSKEFGEVADTSLAPVIGHDAATLTRILRQLELLTKRNAPRIAFKAKGKIVFLDLFDILVVQAEGNYVLLRHRHNSYLLRESLSSMAERLRPYGFSRIHRSVIVNSSAVEEIQPLPTGEYGLRVKGGKEYLVTRKYKHNLRELAQLWVGSTK